MNDNSTLNGGSTGKDPMRFFRQNYYSPGEMSRLRQIVRDSGTSLILPYDQFIEHDNRHVEPNEVAANPDYICELAKDGGYNAVAIHYGVAKRFWTKLAGEVPLLLKINGKTSIPDQSLPLSVPTSFVEDAVRKAADDTLKHLGIRNVSKEIRENLGKLKYRTSYGQNVLIHSIEVATLAGKMAAEMGYDPILAKRAGLLHDIGKAATGDSEGSHITLGADIAERAKEHPIVINCIFAHHDEAEPIHPISVLVTAADKISSSRPGARRDSVESYAQRIENLEKITDQFQGIRNVYAINAGREIRVIADANQINDLEANILSEDIADKIREELRFAGQIKVTVIREKKAVQLTDDPKNFYNNYRNKSFEKAIAS